MPLLWAAAVIVAVALAPAPALAFVCGGSSDGSELQDGGGAMAQGAGSNNTACGENAEASGGNGSSNSAYGFAADASGINGTSNTAVGSNADASGLFSANVAIGGDLNGDGIGANASVSGGPLGSVAGTAVGADSAATGASSSAYGHASEASGDFSSAYGIFSEASGANSSAYGSASSAEADQSTAIGAGARVSAGHTNSTALGSNATTTRANQIMMGTSDTTYTTPGVTSNASKAAQGAPTHVVTSNAAGDLAAYTPAQLGLATRSDIGALQSDIGGLQSDIGALQSDIGALQSDINRLGRRDKELTEGLAAVASLAQPILRSGQRFGVTGAWGFYDDANAVGFSAAGVLVDDVLRPGSGTLALFGGIGTGIDEGEVAGRAGFSFGW